MLGNKKDPESANAWLKRLIAVQLVVIERLKDIATKNGDRADRCKAKSKSPSESAVHCMVSAESSWDLISRVDDLEATLWHRHPHIQHNVFQ